MIYRAEHPKPQFMRSTWENLNGEWEFEFDFSNSGAERGLFAESRLAQRIIVPFCVESELSGIGYKDFIPSVWYKRSFDIKPEQKEGRVVLHFGAVDYKATVYVNGSLVGSHSGGYSSFSFDITDFVGIGENTVTLSSSGNIRFDGRETYAPQIESITVNPVQ